MAVSRRRFLHNGVLAAAACATKPLLALSGPQRPAGGDNEPSKLPNRPLSSGSNDWTDCAGALDHIHRNQFSGAIGENFEVLVPNAQSVWVTLVAVEDLPQISTPNTASFAVRNKSAAIAPATSGFILRFGSSSSLPQGTYLFRNATLGSLALFVVPAADSQSYIAVINRLDNPTIIAVPFSQPAAQSGSGAVTSAPAISSGTGTPLPSRAETPAVRRALVRD